MKDVLVIRLLGLGPVTVIHVFYEFGDWEFSGTDCFMGVDCEVTAEASQMIVCVMIQSLWAFGGLFIHVWVPGVDLGVHW